MMYRRMGPDDLKQFLKDDKMVTPYERKRYWNMGYKVKIEDGIIVKYPLSEEDLKRDKMYSKEMYDSFHPVENPPPILDTL